MKLTAKTRLLHREKADEMPVHVEIGETFECDAKRAKVLVDQGEAEEVAKAPKPDTPPAT
ncbi:hypothetical protein tb265_39010 [Gemmatimonadetes bacterium T265]|nr:hypothetical protein tb265_39010 [Gemmatimonadetes bacterium T265]